MFISQVLVFMGTQHLFESGSKMVKERRTKTVRVEFDFLTLNLLSSMDLWDDIDNVEIT